MQLKEIKTSITDMSDDELREFIVENRKAQKRYREEYANTPKAKKPASITETRKKEEKLKAILQAIDPDILQKPLAEQNIK